MTRRTKRPFPPYRHLPGTTPHPERDPAGHMHGVSEPKARKLTPERWHENDDFLYGIDLFNAGYYWEAHTFWERLWAVEETGSETRRFLQALVQMAAACLKVRQGEIAGAKKLLERAGANRPRGTFSGVDLERLEQAVLAFVEESGGPPVIQEAREASGD